MKTDLPEIQFECPKCQRRMSGDQALINELISCPDCGEVFQPSPNKTTPLKANTLLQQTSQVSGRSGAIRFQAQVFILAAVIIFGAGFLAGFFALLKYVASEDASGSLIIAGSCAGIALGLYLIAQVVQIRANTEK